MAGQERAMPQCGERRPRASIGSLPLGVSAATTSRLDHAKRLQGQGTATQLATGLENTSRVIVLPPLRPSTVYANMPLRSLENVSVPLPTFVLATADGSHGRELNAGPVVREMAP